MSQGIGRSRGTSIGTLMQLTEIYHENSFNRNTTFISFQHRQMQAYLSSLWVCRMSLSMYPSLSEGPISDIVQDPHTVSL